ncbi:hypothetical protein AOLI_G00234680 [Acnodon oligacanthus]
MDRETANLLAWVTVVLLTPVTNSNATTSDTANDPCNNYTALDQPWRATNAVGLYICDGYFNWNGWYRLLYYGMSIRMPESRVEMNTCGSAIALYLNGTHPQIADGIVTRGLCGSLGSNSCYWSMSIQLKACPGSYYVYEFKPTPCLGAYCAADSANLTFDPCNVYSVLANDWRKPDSVWYSGSRASDDTFVEWSGWYRLYLQGKIAQIPESDWCASYMACGSYTALFLGGSHPLPQDGIVTREIYGSYVALDTPSYDPCNNYTSLNQSWRATNETGGSNCDHFFIWNGWYRLLYYGMSVRMADSCVNRSRCGTDFTLWLNGSHPQIEDGIVTRGVCGRSGSDCCYYRSTPIRVKACPGNYYVYELVRPTIYCYVAYCADVSTTMPVSTTTTTAAISTALPTTPIQTITMAPDCQGNISAKCADDIFKQIEKSTNPVLSPEVVEQVLKEQVLKVEEMNAQVPLSAGITMLNKTETLVSTLVMPTETNSSVKISLNGLDVQVFTVGPKASLTEIPRLSVNNAQMVIDLIQISKNNNGSAAVAFMSYTNISSILKPTFFNTTNKTEKTMMSNVVSATLPKTTNTQLSAPVNFTLKHIADIDPNGTLTCVYWNDTEWIIHGCILLQTNSSHTVCSCDHLSTFALIMQTNPPMVDNSDPVMDLFNTVAVAVGLFFLSLTLLTFAFCRRNPRVTNTALTNLCISLLLAHLLFLLTQTFLPYIRPQQANMILFFVILVIILSTLKSMKSNLLRTKQAKSDQRLFKSVILKTMVQFYIVGCSWILGFFPNYNKVLDILFLFFNSQQGTFIFLIHCALNQEVRQFYIKWWRALRAAFEPRTKRNVDTSRSAS